MPLRQLIPSLHETANLRLPLFYKSQPQQFPSQTNHMASLRRLISVKAMASADEVSSCLAFGLVLLMLMSSMREAKSAVESQDSIHGLQLGGHRLCDEIYVVGEGETLHTISDKCGDPYIIEQNPHINDSDDVYPGLVLLITPSKLE